MGKHLLIELGSGLTPGSFDSAAIDGAYWCANRDAFSTCQLLAQWEGILVGRSSGGAVFVALRVAAELGPGHNVVAAAPHNGSARPVPRDDLQRPLAGRQRCTTRHRHRPAARTVHRLPTVSWLRTSAMAQVERGRHGYRVDR
jgi:hypothetical protein